MPIPSIRQLRRLIDVAWSSVSAATPWLRYNPATDRVEGAAAPQATVGSPTTITANSATETPLTIKGAAGQAAPLLSIKDASGVDLFEAGGGTTATLSLGYDTGDGATHFGLTLFGNGDINCAKALFGSSLMYTFGALLSKDSAVTFTNGGSPYNAQDSTITRQNPGILRVSNPNISGSPDGGIVQAGVYVAAANAPATTAGTIGSIARKIAAYDESGNLLGYIPIYSAA